MPERLTTVSIYINALRLHQSIMAKMINHVILLAKDGTLIDADTAIFQPEDGSNFK
jgi:hypothetical protein